MDLKDLRDAATPSAIRASLDANAEVIRTAAHEHAHGSVASVRTAEHAGHEIVIRTTYDITVDGRPFDAGLVVDNDGRVHYHGLPTRDFGSAIDLVAKAIDQFPGDFAGGPGHDHGDTPGHGHEHGHPEGLA